MKRFSFSTIGIEPGELIYFSQDSSIVAKVHDENFIEFENSVLSLSGAALKILEAKGKKRISVRGPAMWCYKGELLSDMVSKLKVIR